MRDATCGNDAVRTERRLFLLADLSRRIPLSLAVAIVCCSLTTLTGQLLINMEARQMKRRLTAKFITLALGAFVVYLLAALILCQPPGPDEWTTEPAFRCWGCGSPALVNPDDKGQWCCPACRYTTRRLRRRFRMVRPDDIEGDESHWQITQRAIDPNWHGSPYYFWAGTSE